MRIGTSVVRFWAGAMLVIALGVSAAAPARAADSIPVATSSSPTRISPTVILSPSGKFMALSIANKSGRTILAVSDVDMAKPPVVVAASTIADIRSFAWVNDDWLVYNVTDLQAPLRDGDFGPGLFSVRRDGTQARHLIRVRWNEFVTGTSIVSSMLDPSHFLIQTLRDGSSDVIVGQVRFSNLGEVLSITPKRLDVSTGRATIAELGYPSSTRTSWVFDRKGVARVAQARHDGFVETFWREADGAPWRSLQRRPELDRT